MYIGATIICVDYSDFLAHTLPFNRNIFNHLVVITSTKDKKTQKLCKYWNIHCVATDIMYSNGDKFNKAKAINEGLKYLDQTPGNFLCHLDADILLPPNSRRVLDNIQLDPSCVYGVDRQLCKSYEEWADFLIDPDVHYEQDVFVMPNRFKVGVRIAKSTHQGYIPIGFFQLWGSDPTKNHYPEEHDSCARSDMLFSLQWDRPHRQMIPEIFATHLESESNSKMGANWQGRTTKVFTASRPVSKVDAIIDNLGADNPQA